MKTAREHADKIWGTKDMTDLSEFTIPLDSAIHMMEEYAKGKTLPISFVSGSLLRETAMRTNIAMPETEEDVEWFEETVARSKSGDFMERLYKCLDLGNNDP